MNHYISFALLLAVAGLSHGNAIGYSYGYGLPTPYIPQVVSAPVYSPAAISTANMVKAAPIPVIKTYAAPVYTTPLVLSKPIISAPYYGYPYYGYGLAKSYAPWPIFNLGLGYGYGKY